MCCFGTSTACQHACFWAWLTRSLITCIFDSLNRRRGWWDFTNKGKNRLLKIRREWSCLSLPEEEQKEVLRRDAALPIKKCLLLLPRPFPQNGDGVLAEKMLRKKYTWTHEAAIGLSRSVSSVLIDSCSPRSQAEAFSNAFYLNMLNAGDWTRDFVHWNQMLGYWATTSPSLDRGKGQRMCPFRVNQKWLGTYRKKRNLPWRRKSIY